MTLSRMLAAALMLAVLVATRLPAQSNSDVQSNLPGAGFDQPAARPASAGPTRTQPLPQTTVPTLHVTTSETVVDVLVTDAEGKPVRDLKQSDFTISEDGKPQPVRSFVETRKESSPISPTPTSTVKLPPNTYTNRRPPPATGSSNIILIDTLNVGTPDLMHSRREAAQYLNSMPPGTQVAIFELSNKLRIVEGFSSDASSLIAAMDDNKNSLLQPAGIISPCYVPDVTLKGLQQIAAFVSGIKGRKNLLWFVTQPPPEEDLCDPNLGPKAFDMLAAAQVAIYPIDVRGVFNPSTADASRPFTGATVKTGPSVAAAAAMAYTRMGAEHLDLDGLAERTGGIAFYNTNNLPAVIGSAIESGANYYTLSYVPPLTAYDGRHHTIHVTVNRSHLTLVYRPGYGADDPKSKDGKPIVPSRLASTTPDPSTNTLVDSMARFAPAATQLLFDVKLTRTTSPPLATDPPIMGFPAPDSNLKSKPLTRFDILYSLPPDQLDFSAGADNTHDASVQFVAVASDVFGKVITSATQTMQLPLTPSEYADFLQHPFQFFQQLDLPPGQIFLRIGVLDSLSNKVGTLEISLTVGKASAASHPDTASGGEIANRPFPASVTQEKP